MRAVVSETYGWFLHRLGEAIEGTRLVPVGDATV
jgi:hypothetical protein